MEISEIIDMLDSGLRRNDGFRYFREALINSVFVMPAKAGIQEHIKFPGFRLAGLRPLAGMTN
jgi:hypothetical protein